MSSACTPQGEIGRPPFVLSADLSPYGAARLGFGRQK